VGDGNRLIASQPALHSVCHQSDESVHILIPLVNADMSMCSDGSKFGVEQRIFICCSCLKTESTSQCHREFQQNTHDVSVSTSSAMHTIVKKMLVCLQVLQFIKQ
jgi:hypothetical protein